MEFIIKPNNKVEYKTRKKLLKCSYVVNGISILISADDPWDLYIMRSHKKLIEKSIINHLNKKSTKLKNEGDNSNE